MFELFGKTITVLDLILALLIPAIVFLVSGGLAADAWHTRNKDPRKMTSEQYENLNERRMTG